MQPWRPFSGLEHLDIDAASSRSFLTFEMVHRPPSFQVKLSLVLGLNPGQRRYRRQTHGRGSIQVFKVASKLGPDIRFLHLCWPSDTFTKEWRGGGLKKCISGFLSEQDESRLTTVGSPLPRRLHGLAAICPPSLDPWFRC